MQGLLVMPNGIQDVDVLAVKVAEKWKAQLPT
jgi:hypothetical protein